jgi:DNA polymerase (family 10)
MKGVSMDKRAVARTLEEIGRYLQIEEKNRFRSLAYLNAARKIDSLDMPIDQFVRLGEWQRTPGIGKATGAVIEEVARTGTSSYLQELRARYPAGIFELLSLPGLGLRKIGILHKELGISSVDDLESAVRANRLLALRGFGPKTQQKIGESIEFLRSHRARFLLPKALAFAEMLREHVEQLDGIDQAAIAGSIRRRFEVVKDINLCLVARDLTAAAGAVRAVSFLERIEQIDARTLEAQSRTALPVRIHLCAPSEFATTFLFTTGSAAFVEALVQYAGRKGFVLEPEGLWKKSERIPLRSEEALFRALGVTPVEPELREEPPADWKTPARRLVDVSDLRGTFHVHSTFSDGKATILEMLDAARERGMAYVGLSDHSPTAAYAGGLTEERLAQQHAEIEKHRPAFVPMRIFRGTESDILMTGDLDYPPETLAKLDFVIASIHSRFKMTPQEMTARMLRALRNPFVTFLGHMTGRLLLSREGYKLDFDAVFEEAGRQGVIIEINGNPRRLDIDWRLMQRALSFGVGFSIHPDAHSVSEYDHLVSGVWTARKGALTPAQIFNTKSVEEVEDYLAKRRTRAIKAQRKKEG